MANLRPVPGSVSSLVDRYARSLVEHRRRWTALALALLAGAGWLAGTLGIRTETSDFLPRGARAADPLPPGVAPGDPVVVVVEAGQPMTAAEVGPLLDSIADRLGRSPQVRRVEYRVPEEVQGFLNEALPHHLLMYYTPAEIDTLAGRLDRTYIERALLGRDPPIQRTRLAVAMGVERSDPLGVIDPALRRLRELGGASRVKVVGGYLGVPDQRSYFLLVEPATSLQTVDAATEFVAVLDSALSEVQGIDALQSRLGGKRLYLVGRSVAVAAGTTIAVTDLMRVGSAAVLMVVVFLMLALRRVLAPLLIIGTVLAGITMTGAVAALVVGSLNLVSWLFIAALIGFGDEFALYIVSHYWLTAAAGSDRATALADALRRPGPGILLGGVTTAGAFLALGVMRYPVMTELAWFSTLGMLLILGAAFTLLPLALAWTAPGRDAGRGVGARLVPAQPPGAVRGRLLGWGLFVLASLVAARQLSVEFHPWRLAVRGVPQSADLAQLSTRLGASISPFLMVSHGRSAEEALDREREAVLALDAVRDEAGMAAVVALSRWLPSQQQQAEARKAIAYQGERLSVARFNREFRAVAAEMSTPDSLLTERYLPLISRYLDVDTVPLTVGRLREAGLGPLIDRHLVEVGDSFVALAHVYPTSVPWAPGVVERFQSTLASVPQLGDVQFVGEALQGATRAADLRRDFTRATLLAVAFTLVVLVARFRTPWPVFLALVPVACGLSAVFGLMALLRIELNLLSLVVVPVILGLGSDDGIHIVDRLARGAALEGVLRDTGTPMVITTLTTIAGLACLGLASFPSVAEMGLVASCGLLVCLGASLHLVPALHNWQVARQETSPRQIT